MKLKMEWTKKPKYKRDTFFNRSRTKMNERTQKTKTLWRSEMAQYQKKKIEASKIRTFKVDASEWTKATREKERKKKKTM